MTYVGQMQTNIQTALWQAQVPHSCVRNSKTNKFNSNCKQENESQKISVARSVPCCFLV